MKRRERSGQTNTLTLDNIFNLQAMDDPPDITSSSDNYGMTIMVRWKMTNFYGVTSNTSGLANNSWAITNNSRYASGTATDSGISDGTTFATNGSADLVNGATGSGNATTIAEQTSSTNGAVTATEFSEYPYDNGLSIRFKRVVSSSVDGSGGVSSNIFSTLTVYDVRVAVTSRIDRYNDTPLNISRFLHILCRGAGGTKDTKGMSGTKCAEVHQGMEGIRGTDRLTDR